MRKFVYLPMAVLAILTGMWSCKQVREEESAPREESVEAKPSVVMQWIIKADMEAPSGTRSSLDGNVVRWTGGDAIKVFNAAHPSGVVYTLTGGAGTPSGTFSGDPLSGGGPYYAVYPAAVAGSLSGEAVSVNLPQTQELTSGSFGNGANLALAVSSTLQGGSFQFRNALGAVSFTLNGNPSIRTLRIQTKGTEALWGSGSLQMSDGVPSLSLTEADTDHQAVYLSGAAQTGTFYLMLPQGALSEGFMAEFINADNLAMVKAARATENNTVQRNQFLTMPAFDFTPQLKAAFLEPETFTFGSYENVGTTGTLSAFTFNKLNCQYAFRTVADETRYVRLQSLPQSRYFAVTVPYAQELGTSADVTVTTVEGSAYASADATYKPVKSTNEGVWYVSDNMQKGFILLLED